MYEGKQPSWYGSVQHILQNMPSLTNFLTDKTSTFKYKCNTIVKQHYLELWTKQAHSLKEGKLRTYSKIKTNFGYENYLSIIKNFEQRRRLSKLRISAHKLQIEIGRYQSTLRENRICCRCTSGQVEDEIHYLQNVLRCTCHANHREIFTTYLTSECQNFQNLDDKCKLIWILNNEDPTISLSISFINNYLIKWNWRSANWMTCIEHEKENIPFGIVR